MNQDPFVHRFALALRLLLAMLLLALLTADGAQAAPGDLPADAASETPTPVAFRSSSSACAGPAQVSTNRYYQRAKLTASDGAADDRSGQAVAVDGDTIAAGAYLADVAGNADQGSVYVFVKPAGGWAGDLTEFAKLTASDGAADDYFGVRVAVNGELIAVGAYLADVGANPDQGAVYLFVKPSGGWTGNLIQTAKLIALDGAAEDYLGVAVAISGDTVVVGADRDDVSGKASQGSAYVFVEPDGGWAACPPAGGIPTCSENAKLTASDGEAGDQFGFAVAISGDTVAIGAVMDNVGSADQGSAYIFVEPVGGWSGDLTQAARLIAADAAADDRLGHSIAISGATVAAGAYRDDIGGNVDQGSAYVFDRPGGGWATCPVVGGIPTCNHQAKLTASDGAEGDEFGAGVAISGDVIVVGAPWSDGLLTPYQGSAYLFVQPGGGWTGNLTENAELLAADGAASDGLGWLVGVSGNTAAAGATFDDIGTNENQGSAYVFSLSVWTGRGATNHWSDAANWSGGVTPAPQTDVIFDDTSGKAATLDADVTIASMNLHASYAGSISQGSSDLTVGDDWSHAAGTFGGGAGALTLGDTFRLTAGTFTAPSGAMNVAGFWCDLFTPCRGAFNHNNGTVVFDGSSAQIINGSHTFYDLTVNSGAAVGALASIAVNNTLVNNGQAAVIAGADLTVDGALINNGLTGVDDGADWVVNGALTNNGELRQARGVTGAGDVAFLGVGGYGGVTLNANGLDLGSTVVSIKGNQECTAVVGATVRRCFDIEPTNAAGRDATITFFFASSEIPAGQACSALNAYRWDGSDWQLLTLDASYGTNGRACGADPQSLRVQHVDSFSAFILKAAGSLAPDLTISRSGDHVLLTWTHDPAFSSYQVWRSTQIYFTPGAECDNPPAGQVCAVVSAPDRSYTHTGAAADIANNHAYLLLGVTGAGQRSGPSNRVGEFGFGLTPGSP
jgi:hypothetical protein